jgi:hypothetical protein
MGAFAAGFTSKASLADDAFPSSFFIGGFSDFIGPTAAAATTDSLCFSTPLATSFGTVAVEVVVVNCSEDDPAESSSVFKEGSD